jgi:hypothetical protein
MLARQKNENLQSIVTGSSIIHEISALICQMLVDPSYTTIKIFSDFFERPNKAKFWYPIDRPFYSNLGGTFSKQITDFCTEF